MKLSVFNKKAPQLINSFSAILDSFLNKDTEGLNMAELKASINGAMAANAKISTMLNTVSRDTLSQLRTNSAAGGAYFKAVDHNASLNNLLPVLMNFVNEEIAETEEEELSIDDIMSAPEESTENAGPNPIGPDATMGTETAVQEGTLEAAAVPEGTDANMDGDIDEVMDSGNPTGGDEDVEIDEVGDDAEENCSMRNMEIPAEQFNFAGVSKAKVVAKATNSVSGIVPANFLQ